MTGLSDADIRLTDGWQLTRAVDEDASLCSGLDCLYQNIALEVLTQPGDLFYDLVLGWGLRNLIRSKDSELTRLEIAQWPRLCLQKREVTVPESISISVSREDDTSRLRCISRFTEEDEAREPDVVISSVGMEAVESD